MNGHNDEMIQRVPTYGKGDRGKINFLPMMACVALRVIKVNTTVGGLAIPENSQEPYQTPLAEVLAVGPQVMFTRVGDMVRLSAGTLASKLFVKDMDFVVVREDQIFGIDHGMEQSEYSTQRTREKMANTTQHKSHGKLITEG
jgi:co-chaperonin GroES (HSP10)